MNTTNYLKILFLAAIALIICIELIYTGRSPDDSMMTAMQALR